jgi:putative ABC transport system permease protein
MPKNDWRIAARALARTPTVSIPIIASLSISIAAVTTVFSVVDSVLVRALPFRDPHTLVWVSSQRPHTPDGPFTLPEYMDYAGESRSLQLAAYTSWSAALETSDVASRLIGVRISANAFDVLGASPSTGRLLREADDRADAARVVVLSHAFWQSRFGSDPKAVGQSIRLNGEAHEIVGVLPRHFPLPVQNLDVVAPLSPERDPRRNVRSSVNFLRLFGRVRGSNVLAAQREISTIAGELKSRFPTEYRTKLGVSLTPMHEYLVGKSRLLLTVMFGAAVLLLGVGLANVMNLLSIRGMAKQGEMALRRALGASPLQLSLVVGSEAALLSAVSAVLGTLIAVWAVSLIAASAIDVPRLSETRVDARTLALVSAIAAISTALCSAIPVVASWRSAPRGALVGLGRGQHGTRSQSRARAAFLVAQVSLAVLLIVLTTTMLTSLRRLERVDLGFRYDSTVVARLTLPPAKYRTPDDVARFSRVLEEVLRTTPGVSGAGAISVAPLSGILTSVPFTIPGVVAPQDEVRPNANIRVVTPGYFPTIGARLARGRWFTERDDETGARVAIVSQAMAERYFGGADALGREIRINDNNTGPRPLVVVGVVRDLRHVTLGGEREIDVYIPMTQMHADFVGFVVASQFWMVRVSATTAVAATLVRRALERVDRDVALARVRTLRAFVDDVLLPRRVSVTTLIAFGAVALVLATVGVYSVIAYSVERRRSEIGLRLALGASASAMSRDVLRPAIGLTIVGVVLGIAGAVALRQVVAGLLFGVTPTEPVVLVSVGALLVLTSVVAAWIPARRASRVDPVVALAGD